MRPIIKRQTGDIPMHAWLCTNPTGVDALTWTELPTPTPKAGEVLIEIKAASLNFRTC
jgi:NADPH2:quinone reductase